MSQKLSTVEKEELYGWDVVLEGCAFATGEGSLHVDPGGVLVVYGPNVVFRKDSVRIKLPPGVKVIVDPNTRLQRGFAYPKDQAWLDEPAVHGGLKVDPIHRLEKRVSIVEEDIGEIVAALEKLQETDTATRDLLNALKRKIAEMEGD